MCVCVCAVFASSVQKELVGERTFSVVLNVSRLVGKCGVCKQVTQFGSPVCVYS